MKKETEFYGDYHTHTLYSDGHTKPEDNIIQALKVGLNEIAFTDHGFNNPKRFALTREKFSRQSAQLEILRCKYDSLSILQGVEADLIGLEGKIDARKDEQHLFDVLNVGYHSMAHAENWKDFRWINFRTFMAIIRFAKPSAETIKRNTHAVIAAITKNPVDTLVHINHLFKVDCYEVAKAAADYGTYIELNGKHIITLPHDAFEKMLTTEAQFIVNSDAHRVFQIGSFGKVMSYIAKHDMDMSRIVNFGRRPEFPRRRERQPEMPVIFTTT